MAGDGGDNDGGCVEMTLDFGGFVRSLELSALLLFGGPEWAAQCPTPARKVQLLFFWMDQGSRVFKGNGDDLARAASAPPAAAAHAVHARKQQRRRPPPPTAATAATPRPRPQRRERAAARLWLRLRLRRMRRRCCVDSVDAVLLPLFRPGDEAAPDRAHEQAGGPPIALRDRGQICAVLRLHQGTKGTKKRCAVCVPKKGNQKGVPLCPGLCFIRYHGKDFHGHCACDLAEPTSWKEPSKARKIENAKKIRLFSGFESV